MITVDLTSAVPPFEQVRAQLAAQISEQTLAAGTRLPTVRRLAAELGLAVNTVARAYRELEAAGLVDTRGRGGTVVTAAGDAVRAQLQAAAYNYAVLAHNLGLASREALELVRTALQGSAGVAPFSADGPSRPGEPLTREEMPTHESDPP